MFSVLHECGHGIYEQNLSTDYIYQPIGQYCSLGIHESQSRFYENIIGRSRFFWHYYYPRFQKLTGGTFSDIPLDSFIHAINNVKPSKIRVTADEVTYSLHVIVRFEIERDLITGKITLDELPSVWNQKYKEYLGVDIEDDSEGVLQDTHWSSGMVGYFPTYALGNLYGAQIYHKVIKDNPDLPKDYEEGEFSNLLNYLNSLS